MVGTSGLVSLEGGGESLEFDDHSHFGCLDSRIAVDDRCLF